MLLVTMTIDGEAIRMSDEALNLTHRWHPYIIRFTPPAYRMRAETGGFCDFTFGDISILPIPFEGHWKPPLTANITVQYTASTEAAAVTLFDGKCRLVSYGRESVEYDIWSEEYTQKLLDRKTDYNGNIVDAPKAFGTVTHVNPLRLEDNDLSRPTYDLGGLQAGTVAIKIVGISPASGGLAIKIITDSAHGFSNGDSVTVVGLNNSSGISVIDGTYTISNAETVNTEFQISVSFSEVAQPINAQAYKDSNLSLYQDGRPIPSNLFLNGDGTFSTDVNTGNSEITVIGTADDTTLDEIMEWGATQLGIGSYDNTYARSPSPAINAWLTSQQPLIDFLSDLCAKNTHLFYVKSDTLYLVDMFKDNGSRTYTEFQFFAKPSYNFFSPLKQLKATWKTRYAKVGFVNTDGSGGQSYFIAEEDHEVVEKLYDYGNEINITPYHDDENRVTSALVCMRSIYELDYVTVPIPIDGSLPVPGENLSWTDSSLIADMPGFIRARSISYDFVNHEAIVEGDGVFLKQETEAATGSVTIPSADTVTVDSFDQDIGVGCIWRYVIDDGSRTNMRVGIIHACWDQAIGGNIIMMPDSHSDDIGSTLGIVSFSVDKSVSTVRLRCTTTLGSWVINTIRTIIGAS